MKQALLSAMAELDKYLQLKNRQIDLFVVGGFALELTGIRRNNRTEDVDSAKCIDEDIKSEIKNIAGRLRLKSDWLNDAASTVEMPEGILDRAEEYDGGWKNIKFKMICRQDLITTKASAFLTRRDVSNKDYEDLEDLQPTSKEIEVAISFLIGSGHNPVGLGKKFEDDFRESIDDLRRLSR